MKTLFIELWSLWENGYIESFSGRLWDEPVNGKIFETVRDVRIIAEKCGQEYNRRRTHSGLAY